MHFRPQWSHTLIYIYMCVAASIYIWNSFLICKCKQSTNNGAFSLTMVPCTTHSYVCCLNLYIFLFTSKQTNKQTNNQQKRGIFAHNALTQCLINHPLMYVLPQFIHPFYIQIQIQTEIVSSGWWMMSLKEIVIVAGTVIWATSNYSSTYNDVGCQQ